MPALNVSKLFGNLALKPLLLRSAAEVIGWAQDFWYDPPAVPKSKVSAKTGPIAQPAATAQPERMILNSWNADRPQIMEKIWGEGEVAPGGDYLNKMLVAPLGLQPDNSVLDLAAGLGSMARMLAAKFNVYVDGFELDPQLAARGMELSIRAGKGKHASITAYDVASFTANRTYDCVIARELFYRVPNKQAFFVELAKTVKQKAHLVFTDLVLDAAARDHTPILEWLGFEAGAMPLTEPEIVAHLKQHGFDVRVVDDQTKFYQQEILHGLANFAHFLKRHQLDDDTRVLVRSEIELWARRQAATANGLKLMRFHAIAKG
jgi:cyclopropane fatty-acyl-phospholipid synthase-like methyltransferase